MAKKRTKPRVIKWATKMSPEFAAWFEEMLVELREDSPHFLEHAVIERAERLGYKKKPPKR